MGKETPWYYPAGHLNLNNALCAIPKELLTEEVVARIGRCTHKRVNWQAFSNVSSYEDLKGGLVLNDVF